jgi:hypothetical protein
MKLDKKKMMIIGGILLAVGVGVYFWRKRKAESDALEDLDEDSLIDEEAESDELKKSTTATDVNEDSKNKIADIKTKRPLLVSPNKKRPIKSIGCPPNAVRMGYLQRQGGNPMLAIHIAGEDRPKVRGFIKRGDRINISGTSFDGTYKISKLWTDANGNVGAVYIYLPPIKYKSRETPDRTFENKACITVLGKVFI